VAVPSDGAGVHDGPVRRLHEIRLLAVADRLGREICKGLIRRQSRGDEGRRRGGWEAQVDGLSEIDCDRVGREGWWFGVGRSWAWWCWGVVLRLVAS
jgi:hypothetical protein